MKSQMKTKVVLLMSLLFSGTSVLMSQDVYIKLGGAYRIGSPSNYIGTSSTVVSTGSGQIVEQKGIYGSFGEGKELDCAIGFTGKTLGIEIGFVRVFRSAIDVPTTETSKTESGDTHGQSYTFTYDHSMLAITPGVVIALPLGFYVRAGAILGFPTYVFKVHDEGHTTIDFTTDQTIEFSGSMAAGLTGVGGFALRVAGIKLYVEADVVSLTWAPTSSKMAVFTNNGEDLLATMPSSSINTRYVDGITDVDTDVLRNPEYRKSLKTYYSYSSVGLKAGVMIGF